MKKIDQDVLTVIGSMETEGNAARIYGGLVNGKLDPALYKRVDKVLNAIGGKWNRTHKWGVEKGAHVFADDPRDAIDALLATGMYTDAKREFGAFYTPPELAGHVVALANVEARMSWLEPSAGSGALIRAMLSASASMEEARLVEIDLKKAEALNEEYAACGALVHAGDFLDFSCEPVDRVVMNPPFAKQADIDHVTRAHKFLRPGGRLVAIMSAGVKFRQNKKAEAFKWDVLDRFMVQMEDNPSGSFKVSDTNVETVTVVLRK